MSGKLKDVAKSFALIGIVVGGIALYAFLFAGPKKFATVRALQEKLDSLEDGQKVIVSGKGTRSPPGPLEWAPRGYSRLELEDSSGSMEVWYLNVPNLHLPADGQQITIRGNVFSSSVTGDRGSSATRRLEIDKVLAP